MRELPILVQRSAIERYQRCPRSRWIEYEMLKGAAVDLLGGDITGQTPLDVVEHIGGIVPNKPVFALAVGAGVHKGIEEVLRFVMAGSAVTEITGEVLETWVRAGLVEFDSQVMPYFTSETVSGHPADSDEGESLTNYHLGESRAMVEALVRAWAVAPSGLAWLVEEYEVLAVEEEITCPLTDCALGAPSTTSDGEMNDPGTEPQVTGEPQVLLMARPDAILRHRSTGGIYVWSLKTTKTWDKRKERTGDYDVQGLSELIATEWWLRKQYKEVALSAALGLEKEGHEGILDDVKANLDAGKNPWDEGACKVAGVQMTYLLKGYNSQDKSDGLWKTSSGLVRPYYNAALDEYRLKYEWVDETGATKRLGKGWNRIEPGELNVAEHIEAFNASDDAGLNPLDDFIVNPIPYYRNEEDVAEWIGQTVAQERRIARAVDVIQYRCNEFAGEAGERDHQETVKEWMRAVFPLYRHSCSYPVACQNIPICHEGVDGLASGLYRLRTCNHPIEAGSTNAANQKGQHQQ